MFGNPCLPGTYLAVCSLSSTSCNGGWTKHGGGLEVPMPWGLQTGRVTQLTRTVSHCLPLAVPVLAHAQGINWLLAGVLEAGVPGFDSGLVTIGHVEI